MKEIIAAFDKGYKSVFVKADSTLLCEGFATENLRLLSEKFSRIIYANFNRKAYLYTESMKRHSIDTVLKRSLCRCFVLEDCRNNKCLAENYLLRFEGEADESTLVIIDGFDAPAPSPYMRHLLGLGCRVLVVSEKCMTSRAENALVICQQADKQKKHISPDILNEGQRELLMTLCAMLEHLDNAVPVSSSESGVFDRASVKFYLGQLSEELDSLIEYGIVSEQVGGRIYIEREIRRQVFSLLSPNSENCPTFMNFVGKICDFRILQNVKDISAQLCCAEDNYNSFVSSLEFMCVYTHFCRSDKKGAVRIYNMLVSHMLEGLSMQKGACYSWHLLAENLPYYISMLCRCLEDEATQELIYDDELYMGERLPDIYTNSVKARLDIIRLCVSFIRNTTVDMYKLFECVFENLYKAMTDILEYAEKSRLDELSRLALLDDVIRLCSESFDYFAAIDKDGIYNPLHDGLEKRRIFYRCERESDRLYADSIPFGCSLLSLRLYEVYMQYLSEWLRASEQNEPLYGNTLLKQLHREKLKDRTQTVREIKAHFVRFASGYENFSDIYAKDTYQDISEKRIADNKRFLSRGFDAGTLRGAERYTEAVINAVRESKAPLGIALTVLSPEYPLSDKAFKLLERGEFARHLCENKGMPNLSLQILLETLVCNYSRSLKSDGRRELYENMILYISDFVSTTETHLERMYRQVSSMYVAVRSADLSDGKEMQGEAFCDRLYEKYCSDSKQMPRYCDDYIARALFCLWHGKGSGISKECLRKAIKIREYEAVNSGDECERLLCLLCK